MDLLPQPYIYHPNGPWHSDVFPTIVKSVTELLDSFEAGQVPERHLLRGKDNGRCKCGRDKTETLSYWLYFQHHPGSERWKILGQRFWSIEAWRAWRDQYFSIEEDKRLNSRDGLPTLATIPKRKVAGERALLSEHVVPKKVLKGLLLERRHPVPNVLALNHCAVVTRAEDRRLAISSHPDPFDPWRRYSETGIEIIESPDWTDRERNEVKRYLRIIPQDDAASYRNITSDCSKSMEAILNVENAAEVTHAAIAIVVNRSLREGKCTYDAVRGTWKMSRSRAEKAELVLAVAKGKFVGAFIPDQWLDATPENFPWLENEQLGRIGFEGRQASPEIYNQYVGKLAPPKARGAANPVQYFNIR